MAQQVNHSLDIDIIAKIRDHFNQEVWCRVLWADEEKNVVVEHYGKPVSVPNREVIEYEVFDCSE